MMTISKFSVFGGDEVLRDRFRKNRFEKPVRSFHRITSFLNARSIGIQAAMTESTGSTIIHLVSIYNFGATSR